MIENSNEIIALKERIKELERKLNLAHIKAEMQNASASISGDLSKRRRFYSESVETKEEEEEDKVSSKLLEMELILKEKESIIGDTTKQLRDKSEEYERSQDELRLVKRKVENLELHLSDSNKMITDLRQDLESKEGHDKSASEEAQSLQSANSRYSSSSIYLRDNLESITILSAVVLFGMTSVYGSE